MLLFSFDESAPARLIYNTPVYVMGTCRKYYPRIDARSYLFHQQFITNVRKKDSGLDTSGSGEVLRAACQAESQMMLQNTKAEISLQLHRLSCKRSPSVSKFHPNSTYFQCTDWQDWFILILKRLKEVRLAALLPVLEISGPNGERFSIELSKDRLTVGRFRAHNDIGLEPDPQQLVTRRAHCVIERDSDNWWIIDNGSVNRTFLLRNDSMEVVNGRAPLEDGDAVRILGLLTENSEPIYWDLVFHDPLRTNPVTQDRGIACLEYDWVQAKLFQVKGSRRDEIRNLRPQEHKLIRYMDQRNRINGYVAVMCTYEELITAIWGDEIGHVESEVNHLIWELRQKIELNPNEPTFVQAVKGLGYRLETRAPRR